MNSFKNFQNGIGYLEKDKSGNFKLKTKKRAKFEEFSIKSDVSLDDCVVMKKDNLNTLLEGTKELQNELLKLRLEREVLMNMPVDFDDVMVVALKECEKNPINIFNTRELILNIKKRYPNLFLEYSAMPFGEDGFDSEMMEEFSSL